MGLKRFQKAAVAFNSLRPLQHDSRYLPEDAVREKLEEREKLDPGLLEPAACSEFKAASVTAQSSVQHHVTGVAAGTCRHGVVVCLADMHTAENFVYYECFMEHLRQKFGPGSDTDLQVFFLDVACKFAGYYERCSLHLTLTLPASTAFSPISVWCVVHHLVCC